MGEPGKLWGGGHPAEHLLGKSQASSLEASPRGRRLSPPGWAVCLSPQRPLLANSLSGSLWAASIPHSSAVTPPPQ